MKMPFQVKYFWCSFIYKIKVIWCYRHSSEVRNTDFGQIKKEEPMNCRFLNLNLDCMKDLFVAHSHRHDRFGGMETVFSFLIHNRMRTIDDGVFDFVATVGRKRMHVFDVWFG